MEDKKLMVKIRPKGYDLGWCTTHAKDVENFLDAPNEDWELKTIEMTQREIEDLEEFAGW